MVTDSAEQIRKAEGDPMKQVRGDTHNPHIECNLVYKIMNRHNVQDM